MNNEFSFDGQRAGEKILAVIKNHPFVLFVPGLKAVFFWLIAAASIIFWLNEYSALLALAAGVVGLGFFSRSYFIYSQSMLIITSDRVVNIDQQGFWGRKITETEIVNIQDISSHTKGLVKTILKYGDLVIRTSGAAQGSEIVVRNIPNPYEVQQIVINVK